MDSSMNKWVQSCAFDVRRHLVPSTGEGGASG